MSYVTIFFIWHCYSILTNRCSAVFKNSFGNKKWARHSNVTLASGMQMQFDCHTNHVPICTFDNLWLCVLILDFGYDMWDLPFYFVIKLFKTPGKGWILCAIWNGCNYTSTFIRKVKDSKETQTTIYSILTLHQILIRN